MSKLIKIRDHRIFAFQEGDSFVDGIQIATIAEACKQAGLSCPLGKRHDDTDDTVLWFVHLDNGEFPRLFNDTGWKNKIVCRFSKGGNLTETDNNLSTWLNKGCKKLTSSNCRGAKTNEDFFIVHVLNYLPMTGEKTESNVECVAALCRLTRNDAEYILTCGNDDNVMRVEFSTANAEAGKHSEHSQEDYDWLNRLFNKPESSDTLVAWHILAQAYELSNDTKKPAELLVDRSAWRINEAWGTPDPEAAKRLIVGDFNYLKANWNLQLENEEKTLAALKDFAGCVYGGDPITPDAVTLVSTALKAIFNGGAER